MEGRPIVVKTVEGINPVDMAVHDMVLHHFAAAEYGEDSARAASYRESLEQLQSSLALSEEQLQQAKARASEIIVQRETETKEE